MKKKSDLPPPPRHLKPETAKWWTAIVSDYCLEPCDLRVLETACLHWDRADEARGQIRECKTGALIEDRFGQLKPHPSVEIEQNATRLFLAALRQVGLGLEPANGARLPDPVGKNLRD